MYKMDRTKLEDDLNFKFFLIIPYSLFKILLRIFAFKLSLTIFQELEAYLCFHYNVIVESACLFKQIIIFFSIEKGKNSLF